MRAIDVADASQIAEARRAAVGQAQARGFHEAATGRVAIVATELASNLVKHGSGGTLLVGSFDDPTGSGVECVALDRGVGILDISASMRDGYSTAGSPGTGLGAVSRGADLMQVYSRPGAGTAVLARLGQDGSRDRPRLTVPPFGVVAVAAPGEHVSGDAWSHAPWEGGWSAMVADGLGHGPSAAEAAQAAVRRFTGAERDAPNDVLAAMHGALKPTRGAAVSIARVDNLTEQVVFAGVGNVAGAIFWPGGEARRMACNNGTIGHVAKHMHPFTYEAAGASALILASDGLTSGWRLDGYPGLLDCHPTLVAAVLYRDFNRGRDDVTVLVCRMGTA